MERSTNNPAWLAGPPYAVSEEVFDEEDIIACTQTLNESEDGIENDERTM